MNCSMGLRKSANFIKFLFVGRDSRITIFTHSRDLEIVRIDSDSARCQTIFQSCPVTLFELVYLNLVSKLRIWARAWARVVN